MSSRILVVRGGALGDFILTLPALNLLREAFPEAHIELLGYRHILSIAHQRHYADGIRSIESRELASFFNPKAELDPEWSAYFSGFRQVVSYLFDPDGFFESNLRRAGVKHIITGSPKITDRTHAAVQLAEPLQRLALFLDSAQAKFYPKKADQVAASEVLGDLANQPFVAIHPGSGGKRKNWPIAKWEQAIEHLRKQHRILIVGGESDSEELAVLRPAFPDLPILENPPLPTLGAVLSRCALFLGHDSGISHLAAAAGAPCLLLFGPTDPTIWGPAGDQVHVLTSPTENLEEIQVQEVTSRAHRLLSAS